MNKYQLESKYMSFDNIEITDKKDVLKLLDYGHFLQAKDENNENLNIFKYGRNLYVYKTDNNILDEKFDSEEKIMEILFKDFILLRKISKKFINTLHEIHVKFSFMNINRKNLRYMMETTIKLLMKINNNHFKKDEYIMTLFPEILLINNISSICESPGKYKFEESKYYTSMKYQKYKSVVIAFTYIRSNMIFSTNKEITKEKFDCLVKNISETQTTELDKFAEKSIKEFKERKKYYPESVFFIISVGLIYLELSIIIMNLQRGGIYEYVFSVFVSVVCIKLFLKYNTVDRRKENLITIKLKDNKSFETFMYYPKTIDIIRFIVFIIVASVSCFDGIIPAVIYIIFMFIYVTTYKKLYKKYTGDGKD